MKKSIVLISCLIASASLYAQNPAGAPASFSDAFMMQLDEDKNGSVSKQEFLKPQEAQFAHIDTNKDGQIDRAEIDAFAQKMKQQMEMMRPQGQPQQGR